MTSTIKVDNIQDQDGNNIINENSNTITIGASGDTVTLASGASQTGFGREGSVDWQTGSIKTSTFTAVSGEGYFINQSSSITMNLPAGSPGAIVSVSDYARNFSTYNLNVSANGSEKIAGETENVVLNIDGQASTFVYVDATKGWINVQNAEDTEVPGAFITATGGTITTCGNFKIHTFTSPGTFCVSAGTGPISIAEYLVVAGGGGGGRDNGGGGGAGGFRFASPTLSPLTFPAKPLNGPGSLPISVQGYPITVGAGGGGGCSGTPVGQGVGKKGSNSIFSTITSAGGGGGGTDGGDPESTPAPQTSGGSGGGSGQNSPTGPVHPASANSGNTPPVSPAQGTDGGRNQGSPAGGGGGGGAIAAGTGCNSSANGAAGGDGGGLPTGFGSNGVPCGSFRYYAGGAGGGTGQPGSGSGGAGGKGGGAAGGPGSSAGSAGTANSGGGGGGGGQGVANNGPAAGGSGIVVIRYRFQN